MKYFGVNVGHDPVYRAKDIALVGFNSIRIVLQRHVYLRPYIEECHEAGLAVLGIITGESFDFREQGRQMTIDEAAVYYAGTYAADERGRNLDLLNIGNETDGQEGVNTDGSWTISADHFNRMKTAFVREFRARNPGILLCGVGTVTGQPDRLDGYNLNGLDTLDNHAYAQWPETVGGMLGNYDRFGLPRIVSEFGWPDSDAAARGRYIRDMARALDALGVVGAWVYCWSLNQHVQPFGVVDRRGGFTAAIPFIQELGYGPGAVTSPIVPLPVPEPPPPPVPTPTGPYYVGPGLTKALAAAGETAIGPENYFSESASLVPTEDHAYIWLQYAGKAKRIEWERVP